LTKTFLKTLKRRRNCLKIEIRALFATLKTAPPVSGWNLLRLILSGNYQPDVITSSIKLVTRCFKCDKENVKSVIPQISKLFKFAISNFGYDNNVDLILQLCECLLVQSETNPEYCLDLMSRIFPQFFWLKNLHILKIMQIVIKMEILPKTEIFFKNRRFGQKIKIFVKNKNICQK